MWQFRSWINEQSEINTRSDWTNWALRLNVNVAAAVMVKSMAALTKIKNQLCVCVCVQEAFEQGVFVWNIPKLVSGISAIVLKTLWSYHINFYWDTR